MAGSIKQSVHARHGFTLSLIARGTAGHKRPTASLDASHSQVLTQPITSCLMVHAALSPAPIGPPNLLLEKRRRVIATPRPGFARDESL